MRSAAALLSVVLLAGSMFFGFGHSEAEPNEWATEMQYLPIAREIIAKELGPEEIAPYGDFYISRTNGMKFVLGLAREDEKTDRLQQQLRQALPSDLLVIDTEYKYTFAELKQLQDELTAQWDDWKQEGTVIIGSGIDAEKNRIVIDAQAMSDATKQRLLQYGDKIELNIDPSLEFPQTLEK